MSRMLTSLSTVACLLGGTAMADVPTVAVDIAPVHSLVARVMEGVGTPVLVLPQGSSPHGHSLRPSEAAALQDADVVVWIGEDLTPWMEDAVKTLAEGASVLTLLEADETMRFEYRESTLFEKHSHDHDEDDDHAHDDHDHGDDHHGDDDHAHDDHDDHGHDDHDHGAFDAHAWLSPTNAGAWLNLIAAELSAADPDNAGTYFANASAGRAELDALNAEVNEILAPARGGSFIVFHDAYQYFENDFDFAASGAISIGDASEPSPARLAEIQERVQAEGIECFLAEPQFNPGIITAITDSTNLQTSVIDPLGVDLEPGPSLYPQLIRNMATSLASCF